MTLEQVSHILDADIALEHGRAQVAERACDTGQYSHDDRNPPARRPHRAVIRAEEHRERADHREQDRTEQSLDRFLGGDARRQLVLAEPCAEEQAARDDEARRRADLGLAQAAMFSWEKCAAETLAVYRRVQQSRGLA